MKRTFSGMFSFINPDNLETYEIDYKGFHVFPKMGNSVDTSDAGEFSLTLIDFPDELEEYEEAIRGDIEFLEKVGD
jgi:hypothetical protein